MCSHALSQVVLQNIGMPLMFLSCFLPLLSDSPSLEELVDVCEHASPPWRKLGEALGLPESDLDAIGKSEEEEEEKEEALCREELLKVD